jgi:hypothetical protein
MTILAEDLVKIHDLTLEPVLDFEKSIPVSKEGDLETKRMTLKTALRGEKKVTINAIGESEYPLSFANHNVIDVDIDESCEFTLSDLVNGDSVYLRVSKGVDDLVSFYQLTPIPFNQYQTSLLFHITRKADINTIQCVNRVKTFTLSSSKFTAVLGTITAFRYFVGTVIDDNLFFEGQFDFSFASSGNAILINIADMPVVKYNNYDTPISTFCSQNGTVFPTNGRADEYNIAIFFDLYTISFKISIFSIIK